VQLHYVRRESAPDVLLAVVLELLPALAGQDSGTAANVVRVLQLLAEGPARLQQLALRALFAVWRRHAAVLPKLLAAVATAAASLDPATQYAAALTARDVVAAGLATGSAEIVFRIVQPLVASPHGAPATRATAIETVGLLIRDGLLPDAYAVYSVVLRHALGADGHPAVQASLCRVCELILAERLPTKPAETGAPPLPPDPRRGFRDEMLAFLLRHALDGATLAALRARPGAPATLRASALWAATAASPPPVQHAALRAWAALVRCWVGEAKPNSPWAGGWQQAAGVVDAVDSAAAPAAEDAPTPSVPATLEEMLPELVPLLAQAAWAANGADAAGLLDAVLAADVAALPRRLTRERGDAGAAQARAAQPLPWWLAQAPPRPRPCVGAGDAGWCS